MRAFFQKINWSSAIFGSIWNWIIGGIFQIMGVITFFCPETQPFLNWDAFIKFLPPIAWVIIGFVIWLIGVAVNINKQLCNQNDPQLIKDEAGKKKKSTKRPPRKVIGVDRWKNIKFEEHEFPSSSVFGLGIKLTNNSSIILSGVTVELIHAHEAVAKNKIDNDRRNSKYLPWNDGGMHVDPNAQTIGIGESKTIALVNWNVRKNEIWFPTTDNQQQIGQLVIDEGGKITKFTISDSRTMIEGKHVYFKVKFYADELCPFEYEGYFTIENGTARFDDEPEK